jgi:hypothetical protein
MRGLESGTNMEKDLLQSRLTDANVGSLRLKGGYRDRRRPDSPMI